MPAHYSITESHPTVNKYNHSGRGGAGNTFKAPKTTKGSTAQGPASLCEDGLPVRTSKFSSGRGGAGNIHYTSQQPIFSFDEESERQTSRDEMVTTGQTLWHVGRGGAGNRTSSGPESSQKDSSTSVKSDGSYRGGILARLSRKFDR